MNVLALCLEDTALSPGLLAPLTDRFDVVFVTGSDPDVPGRRAATSPPDPLAILEVLSAGAESCLVLGTRSEHEACAAEASFHTRVPVTYRHVTDWPATLRELSDAGP